MSDRVDCRAAIAQSLSGLAGESLPKGAATVFGAMGYQSDRTLPIATAQDFIARFDAAGRLTEGERANLRQSSAVNLLFQITDEELAVHGDMFKSPTELKPGDFSSYLFFDVELPARPHTRTELSALVRSINKPLAMPALVFFRHGDKASLGVIHRRLSKRDSSKDVLEKVTLVKDIDLISPVRAHLEILNDFAFPNLKADYEVKNFAGLHDAWQKRLDAEALSRNFYREIADWYFWAHHLVEDGKVELPRDCDTEQEKSLFLIRLLTRIIFCWFLVEKRLVPPELFQLHRLKELLKDFNPATDARKPDKAPTYYHAVLQNLFFGTLNMPRDQRGFREKKAPGERYDGNYGVTNLWRHEADFQHPAAWEALAARVPFLNGGLFDCLDDKPGRGQQATILDGFSDNPKLACLLPNDLFFGAERTVDLSSEYGEKDKKSARSKKARVRGLIEILARYKFTIEENTPLEEEIALDPELLGKVFENLLASFNEDTRTTARKALGAFYTPREIVSYMVDEALKAYLAGKVPRCKGALNELFSNKAVPHDIPEDTRVSLVRAIGDVKILDPACGSGAFPMGALHRLVDLLAKLDPNNESWKRDRLAVARLDLDWLKREDAGADRIADAEARIADIEKSFDTRFHALDYARKLYLIESAIYGVDIQPVAVQIAKLRFFISLVVDQNVDPSADNLGVRPLPNLETRLVAADTLIPIEKEESTLFSGVIEKLRRELSEIRHEHFNARSPATKRKWRNEDQAKRQEISRHLEQNHMLSKSSAKALATWDPYDQNSSALFFDSEWMFGLPIGKIKREERSLVTMRGSLALVNEAGGQGELTSTVEREIDSGFDLVIGNPPYVRQEKITHLKQNLQKAYHEAYSGTADLYVYFYVRSLQLLRPQGTLSFITSNKWYRVAYGGKLRSLIKNETTLLHVIDFGDAPVFTAIAYPTILIATKNRPPADSLFRALNWDPETSSEEVARFASFYSSKAILCSQAALGSTSWIFSDTKEEELMLRIRETGRPLKEVVGSRVLRGITTGLNEAFVIDGATRRSLISKAAGSRQAIKPYIRGRDIERWRVNQQDDWIIFTRGDFDLRKQPALRKHLEGFRKRLTPGGKDGRKPGSYQWFEIQDNIAYWKQFGASKIVSTKVSIQPTFALDHKGAYLANTAYFFPVADSGLFLLGLLNSRISAAYCRRVFVGKQGGWYEVQPDGLESFPVPHASPKEQKSVGKIVEVVTWLAEFFAENPNQKQSRDTLMERFWEKLLNGLVYQLYFREEVVRDVGSIFQAFETVEQKLDGHVIRLQLCREIFENCNDPEHPIYRSLDALRSLEVIQTIDRTLPSGIGDL